MTSKRDAGPILAIAGLVVVVAAVIAGFVVVGGPGDARDRRLDELLIGRMASLASIVDCATPPGGPPPADLSSAPAAIEQLRQSDPNYLGCSVGDGPLKTRDIEYSAVSPHKIRLCGDFRLPSRIQENSGAFGSDVSLFAQPRPAAGRHCFDISLPLSELHYIRYAPGLWTEERTRSSVPN